MPTDDEIYKEFENRNIRNIAGAGRRIREAYESVINELTIYVQSITLNGQVFQLSQHPLLKQKIDAALKKLHNTIYTTVVNSINKGWDISTQKNDLIVDKRLASKEPSERAKQILYDPQKGALDSYLKRKEKGLNLSDRVWKQVDPYKIELEKAIAVAVNEGKSAAEMARDIKSYLNEPDKLFRRVRDAEGNLRLSKAAREYKPGAGIYRSSFQNAKRLARTETQTAYHLADHNRWQKLDFIIGFKVSTSNNHPEYDICDSMQGTYSKSFVFTTWHPNCRCFCVPIQISNEEYDKYEDSILGIGKAPEITQVEDIHQKAKDWISKNAERINGWKNTPYWAKDNPKYIKDLLK